MDEKSIILIAKGRRIRKCYGHIFTIEIILDPAVPTFVLDGVTHQQEIADRLREMFAKWLEGSPGTGSQPRTWQTVLDAVGMICGTAAMEDIRTAVQTPKVPTAGKSSTVTFLFLPAS